MVTDTASKPTDVPSAIDSLLRTDAQGLPALSPLIDITDSDVDELGSRALSPHNQAYANIRRRSVNPHTTRRVAEKFCTDRRSPTHGV